MKQQKIKLFLLIVITVFSLKIIHAQNVDKNTLSGNLNIDANNLSANYSKIKTPVIYLSSGERKSRVLAGILSAILPGAGEFYAGRYLKAGILFTVEAAAITTALIYNRRGDNQTNYFQNYANQHWSVIRYAEWTLKNAKNINASVDPSQYNDVLIKDNQGNDVGVNWSRLNDLESALGDGYSHQLIEPGQQQYYELIGKYPQFSHGWDTSNQSDTDFHILTSQFLLYAHARGLANSYYTTGETAVIVIYVNHFLSIFDAIWSVDNYNKSLAVNFRVQNGNLADRVNLVPTLNFSYSF
ncbi:MAG: hypothetical protein ACYCVH_02230 [Ignavibacteriaceae bacterium]